MVALSTYVMMAWGLLFYFIALPDKLHKKENLLVYFISASIMISAIFSFSETLHWIKLSNEIPLSISQLLYCIVLFPMIILLCIHYLKKAKTSTGVTLVIALHFMLTVLLDYIGLKFKIYTFIKWNYLYTGIYFLLLLIICYLALKWFHRLMKKEASSA